MADKNVTVKAEKPTKVVKNKVEDAKVVMTTPRQQISKLIGINLSVSRVRKHIDKNNVNADVEAACSELRGLLALEKEGKAVDLNTLSESTVSLVNTAYSKIYDSRKSKYDETKKKLKGSKVASDAVRLKSLGVFRTKTETLAEKIEYVSKLRCRFSNDASVVLSAGLDYVVQDLVRTAMVHARSQHKAIIQVQHVVLEGFSSMGVYPLIRNLDVVQNALSTVTEGEVEVEGEPDDVVDDKQDSNFEFYINLICKSVKAKLVEEDESYSPIRISKNIRRFCSDVVIQLIERVSPLIKLYASTAKVKTVNDDVVKFIFNFLLLDAGSDSDKFCSFVEERLSAYHSVKSPEK